MSIELAPLERVERAVQGRIVGALASGAPGTPAQWQRTALLLVVVVFGLPILFQLLTHPRLLLRRTHRGPLAEPETRQKVIVSLLILSVLSLAAVTGLDYALGWSHAPVYVVLVGDLLVASGLVLFWMVLRANPFAAAAVSVESGQAVISTGPYALVRHPMYSGYLLVFLGIAPALGTWWGLVCFPLVLVTFIWRLLDEERYLANHLPGYQEYCARVKYRLVPHVW